MEYIVLDVLHNDMVYYSYSLLLWVFWSYIYKLKVYFECQGELKILHCVRIDNFNIHPILGDL